MYSHKYCQQKAIEMYSTGKSEQEVIAMLIQEEVEKEKALTLAEGFYQDYLFVVKEERKRKRESSERDILIGSVILGCGVIFNVASYFSSEEHDSFVFFYGLLLAGGFLLVKGLITKSSLKK
jgi:hypothetical protein